MEIDDPYADAMFRAIHRALPVKRLVSSRTSNATESDVLREFTANLSSNEPLLLFITGEKGTGKSHLVRWLKSNIGSRPSWHKVYVEKRNTSLKQVIERILAGIDTPKAKQLHDELERASSEIKTDSEAMHVLLQRLDHLVKFDTAIDIKGLSGLDTEEINDLRKKADRLLGDFTFRERLSQPGGPLERIVRLARGDTDPDEAIEETDLHLHESDFSVDPSYFEDAGTDVQKLVGSVVSNKALRTEIAAMCDHYLPRAKAEVFTGQTTDLLEVFQDVRREIAKQGQELCLFIEDLVLLHGIDKQLAQALTIPASRDLCKLRAAIAVTSGYLTSVDTFTDRGIHYTLDIDASVIGPEGLRDFVSRYLNAGRISKNVLQDLSPTAAIPNACVGCPVQQACHETFGTSESGYGLYPFNANAVDQLVKLAAPDAFRPREILREVIRYPLGVAEDEILTPGMFPSGAFARSLDEVRTRVPSEVRARIRRENRATPDSELSLRAFYAEYPLHADNELVQIARYLGVDLTEGLSEDPSEPVVPQQTQTLPPKARDEIEQWANGTRLAAATANTIRKFVCASVEAELQNGPYGVSIRKSRKSEWKIGAHTLRLTDVVIDRAQGGGSVTGSIRFDIAATDENAVLLRGILAAEQSGRLDTVDHGRWYFGFQQRVRVFASAIATAGRQSPDTLQAPLRVLSVLRNVSATPGLTVAAALPAMFRPTMPKGVNPDIVRLFNDTASLRDEALLLLRDTITAAKGVGTPSIIDIGSVYSAIRTSLKLRDVSRPEPDDEAGRLLRSLSVKQSTVASKAWSEVAKLVAEVQRSLDVSEDFARTLESLDRLVAEGHQRGLLPRFDSRSTYLETREKVDVGMTSTYSKLASLLEKDPGAADLWDLLVDPRPDLTTLAQYASFANSLLSEMENRLADTASTDNRVDAVALVNELRGLADEFDYLTEATRQ
ncbi:ATP-binding protein [Mycolicibacterium sp. XJ662]